MIEFSHHNKPGTTMTRSEQKVQWLMQELNIGRKTAIAYLEGAEWNYHRAVEDFKTDKHGVEQGLLDWKFSPSL